MTVLGFWAMNLGRNGRVSTCIHFLTCRSTKRNFSERRHVKELSYIDKWFESIVKPKAFYEKHSGDEVRKYFYNIDMHGRLFLGTKNS